MRSFRKSVSTQPRPISDIGGLYGIVATGAPLNATIVRTPTGCGLAMTSGRLLANNQGPLSCRRLHEDERRGDADHAVEMETRTRKKIGIFPYRAFASRQQNKHIQVDE